MPEMYDAHIFDFTNSPYKAQFYNQSFKFEKNKKKIGIVDQFQGKRPIVLNREFVVERKQLDFKFVHTLILDSHIVDVLHRYVSRNGKLDDDTKAVVIDFLTHVSALNCDYSPMFYLAENWAKSTKEQFIKTSSEKLSSILKLHSMDEKIFIETHEIKYKDDSLQHYFELYESNSLEGCGEKWAQSFVKYGAFEYFTSLTKLSYACLLKMVLIHFINPCIEEKNIVFKYYEFEKFLLNDLNLLLGREINLALYYFSSFAGKFVNVQSNMSLKNAKKTLKATAWDLLLLRMPEFLLRPANLPEINTSYVVTSEDKLLSIGDMFNVESLFYASVKDEATPMLSFNTDIFEAVLSKVSIDKLNEHRAKISVKRLEKDLQPVISDQKLDWLIADLELQLGYLCKN